MNVKKLHSWDLSYEQAKDLQRKLAGKVRFVSLKSSVKLIAGLDCGFSKDGKNILACVVVLSFPDLAVIEKKTATRAVTFPYIPGLLSFNFFVVSLAITYPLLVVSIGAYVVNSFIMSLICIVILGTLAPIFVPMMLFEKTKSYFNNWVQLLISLVLSPVVAVLFLVFIFNIFYYGLYGTCMYKTIYVGYGC